jgi:hypothetical protein
MVMIFISKPINRREGVAFPSTLRQNRTIWRLALPIAQHHAWSVHCPIEGIGISIIKTIRCVDAYQ